MDADLEPSRRRAPAGQPPGQLGRLQILVAAAFLGVVTALAGLMAWTAASHRGQLPPLTNEDFTRAQRLWESRAPRDYAITIAVSGRQAAQYHVEVRAGQITVATRDAIPLKQQRTRGTWSVPGMFTTMQSDVDHAEQHRLGTADEGVPQVQLRALFDPEFGYPRRYHRTELRKWGNNEVVSWEVTEFTVPSGGNRAGPVKSGKSPDGTLE